MKNMWLPHNFHFHGEIRKILCEYLEHGGVNWRPTGEQEGRGSILAGSSNILSQRLIMNYFVCYMVILSLPLIQDGQLSVYGEMMCASTGRPLRELSLPRKSVIR